MSTLPHSHQEIVEQLDLMLRARYPLIYIVGAEEEPIATVLLQVADRSQPIRKLCFWDIVRGWNDNGADKGSPMAALNRIAKAPINEPAIFVLQDLHPILKSPLQPPHVPIVREIKNLASELKRSRKTLILTSYSLDIPPEFIEETTTIDFPLPDANEIDYLISQLVVPDKLKLAPLGREQLVKACQGLSRARIQRVLAISLATNQQVSEQDIDRVLAAKQQAIRQTGILEFYTTQESIKSVGGLDNLKQWVRMRQDSFTDEARRYGIPNPKGVLLAGIQGTGKSLSAKTIAHEWRLPLLRLDAGRLFGGLVGESESKVRQMIRIVEAVAPCVLWMDEIDKAFGNISSGFDGDSGTSQRVFGSLITWMQEKTSPVFVVATANNIQILPAELLRKGRFDEIFFLNLPNESERQEIFRVHLQKLRPSRLREFDLELLARHSLDYSGAEIEQAIIEGMQQAFSGGSTGNRSDFNTENIIRALEETVPLAAIARPQIEALKQWASKAGARPASIDLQLSEELRQIKNYRGIDHLEVD
jgi:SpoVK/Ycf46/Vps4 family AAA+-type ATPase